MRKLILTLFLASASLASFAQSTVKTIRVVDELEPITENIPEGTQVVLLSTDAVYTVTVGIAKGTDDFTDFAAAIAGGALVTVTDTNVSTVVVEAESQGGAYTVDLNTTGPVLGQTLGDGVLAANGIVKVYVNGTLLSNSSYSVTITDTDSDAVNTLAIAAPLYKFDSVKIVYDTQD